MSLFCDDENLDDSYLTGAPAHYFVAEHLKKTTGKELVAPSWAKAFVATDKPDEDLYWFTCVLMTILTHHEIRPKWMIDSDNLTLYNAIYRAVSSEEFQVVKQNSAVLMAEGRDIEHEVYLRVRVRQLGLNINTRWLWLGSDPVKMLDVAAFEAQCPILGLLLMKRLSLIRKKYKEMTSNEWYAIYAFFKHRQVKANDHLPNKTRDEKLNDI